MKTERGEYMRIFIGSSSEQHPVAKEIKRDLNDLMRGNPIEIIDWKEWFKQGRFNNYSTWEIIQEALDSFDLAIMLFANDDGLSCRDDEYVMTRDNVLIEAGAFANSLGIENVFLLVTSNKDYKLPSDFLSLNYIEFDYARGADNADAYDRICEKIYQVLGQNAGRIDPTDPGLIKNKNSKMEAPIRKRKGKGKLL